MYFLVATLKRLLETSIILKWHSVWRGDAITLFTRDYISLKTVAGLEPTDGSILTASDACDYEFFSVLRAARSLHSGLAN